MGDTPDLSEFSTGLAIFSTILINIVIPVDLCGLSPVWQDRSDAVIYP